MAKIAIIGSSYSKCLYSVGDEPDMTDWSLKERIKWAEEEWPLAFIKQDYEKHWVNLLANKYPQHEFHIFAKGGAGWQFSEMVLHRVAELKFDRVIVELQEPRLLICSRNIVGGTMVPLKDSRFRSKDSNVFNYQDETFEEFGIAHICIDPEYHRPYGGEPIYKLVYEQVYQTLEWQKARSLKFKQVKPKTLISFTDDMVDYITRYITGPVYATQYRQYLLSLKIVWPKVFDKVGIWAYLSPNIPWHTIDLHAEIFGNKLKLFEQTAIEKWIREDVWHNSSATWVSKYNGADRNHLNKEGMQLLVDFLLKQSSIQEVLK